EILHDEKALPGVTAVEARRGIDSGLVQELQAGPFGEKLRCLGTLGTRIECLAAVEARPLDDDARRRVRRSGLDVKPAHVRVALDPIAVFAPETHRAAPRGGEAR